MCDGKLYLVPKWCLHPQKNPIPFGSHSSFLYPRSQLLLVYFLYPFWIVHINGILQWVAFCGWLLSLSGVFSSSHTHDPLMSLSLSPLWFVFPVPSGNPVQSIAPSPECPWRAQWREDMMSSGVPEGSGWEDGKAGGSRWKDMGASVPCRGMLRW